jgi:hypothetical protein
VITGPPAPRPERANLPKPQSGERPLGVLACEIGVPSSGKIAVTIEVYAEVPSAVTRETLR